MIELSKAIPVNEPGQPHLTRSDVFAGLRMKANNALPFVPAITDCVVTEARSENEFVRDIVLRGQALRELVTLEPETRVTFVRLAGPVRGTIYNEIETAANGELQLRFSFNISLEGVEPGGDAERDYARTMEADYMKAVDATLAAIRNVVLANA
jgi:hypothetical protein